MKIAHALFFLRRNLRRRPGRTLTAVLAIAIGIGIFHLVTALAFALRSQVLEKIEAIFPEHTLLVRAPSIELGPLAFSPGALVPRITPQAIAMIRDVPGVLAVYPMLPLQVPALATGNLMGYSGSTDVAVYGVPPELIKPEVTGRRGFYYADPAQAPVPVVVSRYFVDLFNLGLAESQGLPKLTDKAVIGRQFELVLGASLLDIEEGASTASQRRVRAEVVGLTRNPNLLAIAIPLEYVREFNRWYHGPDVKEQYVQAQVALASTEAYDVVAKEIEGLGLEVEGRRETAQRLRLAVNGAVFVLMLFGLAVLAMALVNIINTFSLIMLERRGELGLLRAVGATRSGATSLLLLESSLIGLTGGLLGSGAAWATAIVANRILADLLPPLSLAPDYWLDPRAGLFIFAVLLAAIGSALATLPVLWRSLRRWPGELLRS